MAVAEPALEQTFQIHPVRDPAIAKPEPACARPFATPSAQMCRHHLCKLVVLLHLVRADAKDLSPGILELAVGIPEGARLLCAPWRGSLCKGTANPWLSIALNPGFGVPKPNTAMTTYRAHCSGLAHPWVEEQYNGLLSLVVGERDSLTVCGFQHPAGTYPPRH